MINSMKSQVVYFRKRRRPHRSCKFYIGESEIHTVQCYKYLCVIFDEYLNFKQCEETHVDAAGRALAGLIHKLKQIN